VRDPDAALLPGAAAAVGVVGVLRCRPSLCAVAMVERRRSSRAALAPSAAWCTGAAAAAAAEAAAAAAAGIAAKILCKSCAVCMLL
jgi:hypothetical protein